MVNVAFKLDGTIVKQLDDAAERLTKERPGITVTRTDVVRMAIHGFLTPVPAAKSPKK